MTCIDSLLGIKDPCDDRKYPNYIDSIGVTLEEVDQYTLSNVQTGKELFEDARAFAFKQMSELVINSLAHSMTGATVTESASVGYIQKSNATIPALTGKLVGFEVESCNDKAPVALYVNTIKLYAEYTGSVDVYVIDLNRKAIIDTITVDAVAGNIVEVEVDKAYSSQRRGLRLGFAYLSEFSSYNTFTDKNSCFECVVTQGWCNTSRTIRARGLTLDTDFTKQKSNAYTFGLFADYSIQCDYSLWLCSFANRLVLPAMYLTGAEIMNHAIESANKKRHNNSVIDVETNTLRRDRMMEKYHEAMNTLIKGVVIPEDYLCFNCKRKFIYT
jgi:hypothetical protein